MAIQTRSAPAEPQPGGVSGRAAVIIFAVLILGNVINAVDRVSFPVFVPNVQHDFGLSIQVAGLMSTISYLGMGFAGFPIGYLLDRYSRKNIYTLGIILFSVTTILTALSAGVWDMGIYRVLSGAGESFQFTACFAVAGALFSRYRGMAVGAINSVYALGMFLGAWSGGQLLVATHSWQTPLKIFGVIGLVLALIVHLIVRKDVVDVRHKGEARRVIGGHDSILNRDTILLVIATIIGSLITYAFIGIYPAFLREHLGYSPSEAGTVYAFNGIGALLSIFGGYIGDKIHARVVLAGAFVGIAIVGGAIVLGPSNEVFQGCMAFLFGAIFSGVLFVNLVGYTIKSVSQKISGIASGLASTAIFLPGAFAGYLFGSIVHSASWTAAGVIQWTVFGCVAALVCLFVRPSTFSRTVAEGA
ncbi:Sialic acid transporter NanT [Castellaniella defragrans]